MNFTGDNCPIVAIILTHFHADHTFGLETFLKVLNKAILENSTKWPNITN